MGKDMQNKEYEDEIAKLKEEIAELKKREIEKDKIIVEQAKHAQMGEMIAMIAHQWRQPLASISAVLAKMKLRLQLGDLDSVVIEESFDKINDYTQYLSTTINDFRNFFRPNKEKSSVEIEEIINKSIELLEKFIDNSNVNLTINLTKMDKIDIFANEILQSLVNIIKNSLDIVIEKGDREYNIEINTKEEENYQVIEIRDDCGGIQEHILEDIFLPYFSTKDEKNGTGLGLYMSKTIVEKHHNGTLNVLNHKNDSGKNGVVFIIKLPKK
jgi:C4-dicarboxylate-specific signal transduction histidine kinase